MGNIVRLVGASTPPPVGGGDPLGLVQDWLDLMESHAVTNLITTPVDPTGESGKAIHYNYDGVWTAWAMAKLLASQNPTVSAALFAHGEDLCETFWAIDDGLGNNPYQSGPSEIPPGGTAPGYLNYNLGPYMYGEDPATSLAGGADASIISANFARHAAYSAPTWPVYYLKFGANSWPSPAEPGVSNPVVPPNAAREHGRALFCHVVSDADYDTYDDLEQYAPYSNLLGHQMFIPRVVGQWFLGQGVDLEGGEAAIDQWRTVIAELAAVDGDWTLAPNTWNEAGYEFRPFMWSHAAMGLIAYFEDATFTGAPHDAYKALIPAAISDLCDASIAWFSGPTAGGGTGLIEGVADPGVPAVINADTNLFTAPMFCWAWKETGNQQYKDFAITLIETALAEAYIVWGKHINQSFIWAYWGFQWLGWTDYTFKLPWKFDIAGGETWPEDG